MSNARCFIFTAIIPVLASCAEAGVSPTELRGPMALTASAEPGSGAIVSRTADKTFILATADPGSGLGTLHYASAAHVATVLPGCVLPQFENGERKNVALPNGKSHDQARFEVYVLVLPLTPGFPFNACSGAAIAEGPIQIHVTFSSGSPGKGVFSVGSNGPIKGHGSRGVVRLHHSLHGPLGRGVGTVQLR